LEIVLLSEMLYLSFSDRRTFKLKSFLFLVFSRLLINFLFFSASGEAWLDRLRDTKEIHYPLAYFKTLFSQ